MKETICATGVYYILLTSRPSALSDATATATDPSVIADEMYRLSLKLMTGTYQS